MAVSATTADRSTERRTIDAERFARALTEPMTVTFDGPGVGEVEHGEQAYEVELAGGVCGCDDYRFRGESIVCKHVIRASLSALFDGEQPNTRIMARVARFAREYGCAHSVRGCSGPTTRGERGLPCQQCINAVRAATVDEYTVWARIVGSDRR